MISLRLLMSCFSRCYCGGVDDDYSRLGELDPSMCNMPCSGYPDMFCGGSYANNVYQITGGLPPSGDSGDTVDVAPQPSSGSDTGALVAPHQASGGGDGVEVAPPQPSDEAYLGCYSDVIDTRALGLTRFAADDMTNEVSPLRCCFDIPPTCQGATWS